MINWVIDNLFVIAMVIVTGLILVWLLLLIWAKSSRTDHKAKQIIILLGSGGHTGELCLLLKGFKFDQVSKVFVIVANTDKSSESYFLNFV